MTRRNLELVLLCVAAPLAILLFAMLAIYSGQDLGMKSIEVPVGLFGVFIIAHLAVRHFTPGADPAILPIVFALSSIGIAFVTRLAPELAIAQLVWLCVGVGAMIVILAISQELEKIERYKYTLMVLGFLLLLSPLIPGLGQEIYGSRIWLSIGPFSFQPGELAKIVIVLFLSGYLSVNREMLSVFTGRLGPFSIPDARSLFPLITMWVVTLLIIVFEKDLGSAAVFFFVFLSILYTATGKKSYLVLGFSLITVGFIAAYLMFGHVQVRVANWIDPFADSHGAGYQMVQALFSMADGNLFGAGIGQGLADQIPVVESDFIFAAIAEETGLLGAAGVLLLYLSFAIRGFLTAARAKNDLSSFVAVGITVTIVLQAFIIVGGVTGLIPLTGLTLPFISQGGSSLLASFIGVGFLLRCGEEGTGVGSEMKNASSHAFGTGVLGRTALGKRLTNTLLVFSVLFAALVVNLTFIMVVNAQEYRDMPENNHTIAKQSTIQRGAISTYDDVVLAQSVLGDDGLYERVYPAGDLASQVVGYYSIRYGTSGIENSQNETLTGTKNYASWSDVLAASAGKTTAGNDVVLSINSEVQRAAQNALQGFSGACVVMDPTTGAVLASASSPTYNANDFQAVLQASSEESSDNSALLNRATQSLYAPGSTFKIVTLTTALEDNVATADSVYDSPGECTIGNGPITNYNKIGHGSISLARATEYSSNTVFAQLGTEIGAEALVKGAEDFGFNHDISFDLPTSTSIMSDPSKMTEWETAWTAVGQPVGEGSRRGPTASVLQMALVGCGIANDGTIMSPYLVQNVYSSYGDKSYSAEPHTFMRATSPETARKVREILTGVVDHGTGTQAQVAGVKVAGKTGTAETGRPLDDSWFVGMAPADNPQVVVAIVLEEAGGVETGAARAQNVLQTTLRIEGLL